MYNLKLHPSSPASMCSGCQQQGRDAIDLSGQDVYGPEDFIEELKMIRSTLVTFGSQGSDFVELDTFCRQIKFLDWLIEDVEYTH